MQSTEHHVGAEKNDVDLYVLPLNNVNVMMLSEKASCTPYKAYTHFCF